MEKQEIKVFLKKVFKYSMLGITKAIGRGLEMAADDMMDQKRITANNRGGRRC